MPKSQLNMRTDSMVLEVFKTTAESRGISQTDLFAEMVNDQKQGKTVAFLEEKLKEFGVQLESKNEYITRLEKQIGKPIQKYRRSTFKLTDDQFNYITNLAHELKIPKGDLMMVHFLKEKSITKPTIPQLEDV